MRANREPPRLKTRATITSLHREEVPYEFFVRDRRDRRLAPVPDGLERFRRAGLVALEMILWSSFRFTLAMSGGSLAI